MQPAHQALLDGLMAVDGGRQAVGQLLQHSRLLGQLVDVPVSREVTAGSRGRAVVVHGFRGAPALVNVAMARKGMHGKSHEASQAVTRKQTRSQQRSQL